MTQFDISLLKHADMILLTVFNIIRSLAISVVCESRPFRLQCLRLELCLKRGDRLNLLYSPP